MIKVFLQHISEPTLLIRAKTGIYYEQQCEGGDCSIRGSEGYLIPLGSSLSEQDSIEQYDFKNNSHYDDFLKLIGDFIFTQTEMDINCSYVDEPVEAYVQLNIENANAEIYGMSNFQAVVLWGNSD